MLLVAELVCEFVGKNRLDCHKEAGGKHLSKRPKEDSLNINQALPETLATANSEDCLVLGSEEVGGLSRDSGSSTREIRISQSAHSEQQRFQSNRGR